MGRWRVLVVEDDEILREVIVHRFLEEGYEVVEAETGAAALQAIRRSRPDLLILDIMLPDVDGVSICQEARRLVDVPVIMLTAETSSAVAVRSLDVGATDYIRKPFDMAELLARVRAALRTVDPRSSQPDVVQVGSLVIDRVTGTTLLAGRDIALSATEQRVVAYLAGKARQVVSKQELLDNVWQDTREPSLVEVHISNIRRKLRQAGCPDRMIRTVHTQGYVLIPVDATDE